MELLSAFSILAGTGVFRIYYLFPSKERNEKYVSLFMFYLFKRKDFSFVHVMSYSSNKTPTANLFYSLLQ